MEKEFLMRMKDELIRSKTELLAQVKDNNSDLQHLIETMESKDSIDIASDAVDGKMLETLGAKDLNRIKLIDNALTRIEQGKYGSCVKCGKKIPQDRLEAIPYALMCIVCKSAEERRNR
ncbi:MAG: TraR/DksA family transcriptional regulator [Treponemataceae bacterium]